MTAEFQNHYNTLILEPKKVLEDKLAALATQGLGDIAVVSLFADLLMEFRLTAAKIDDELLGNSLASSVTIHLETGDPEEEVSEEDEVEAEFIELEEGQPTLITVAIDTLPWMTVLRDWGKFLAELNVLISNEGYNQQANKLIEKSISHSEKMGNPLAASLRETINEINRHKQEMYQVIQRQGIPEFVRQSAQKLIEKYPQAEDSWELPLNPSDEDREAYNVYTYQILQYFLNASE